MIKNRYKFTRRKFLELGAKALAGSLILPVLSSCSSNYMKRKLQFGGQVMGEDYISGHLLRDSKLSIPQPIADSHIYDVVIAGGGPSGLTTAWQLSKVGINNYLIIDKEDVFGGLCRGGEENGVKYSCGAHYASYPEPSAKHLVELYKDCGVITGFEDDGWPIVKDEYLMKKDIHNLYAGGEWFPDDFPLNIANDNDLIEYERFIKEMYDWCKWTDDNGKRAFCLPVADVSESAKVRELDNISMYDYFRQQGYTSELLKWYINIWTIDEYGTPIERCSAWSGIQYFRSIIYPERKTEHPQTLTWSNGLGFMSDKLASFIPDGNKRTSTYVVKMENIDGLVRTTLFSPKTKSYKTVLSKQAVFAIPKMQVYSVMPELLQADRYEFKNLEYSSWLIAVIHTKRLPDYKNGAIQWENTIFDSWTMGYINNHHLQNPPRNANEPHVFTLYACMPYNTKQERYELLNYGWDYWAKVILHELEKAHPEMESLITKMDIWKWGHPMRQTYIGSVWGEKRQKMQQPFGNIHFSNVDIAPIPVFEEAVYLGCEIAKKVVSSLDS